MNISCDVILDLIPLVKDRVASDDSTALVMEHIESCQSCKMEFESYEVQVLDKTMDAKVMGSIKKSLFLMGIALLLIGSAAGITMSNSFGMFYNFLIMPAAGAAGFILLRRRWYITPVGIFIVSYLWLLVQRIMEGVSYKEEIFAYPAFISMIYAVLVTVGALIMGLLKFAFRKEV